ncbi:hypothetical protein PR202_gb15694 [Eleusine coracana subsp. coracana]|uniref:Plastid lipid-associated protein/fibrillin conserved domain-containing protein n=1 Tax=Eleusine coracana subsp. coracana TaxID=191504 RepID=A0AAV5EYY4_ELECO|nr:hypothetical protein PR202_gb15694 [Eleusine coracana subsp. coracana]
MVARVLLPTPPRHHCCHRATATTTSGSGVFSHCSLPAPQQRFRHLSGRGGVTLAAAVPPEQSSLSLAGTAAAYETVGDVKAALYRALEGADRGIFGMTSAKRSEIHGLVELLESRNPTPEPTANLQEKVDGCWKLIYSTISILGKKRTTLGLRDFISLGDFLQIIDVKEVILLSTLIANVRNFLTTYSFLFQRVDIKLESSTITPEQLMNIFQKNYDLLLAIFNPEGWLEITYVDESLRVGRDDKENIFVLEREQINQKFDKLQSNLFRTASSITTTVFNALAYIPCGLTQGIMASGCAFPLMSWCLQKRGPLYVAMFGPLIIVFVAVLSSIFLDETLHLGIALGAILIVGGLYMVLWGKAREAQEKQAGGAAEGDELAKASTPADAADGETK